MRYLFIITALLTFLSNPAQSALVKFKYDQAGNMISEQGKYYEYNDANQLVRVRKDSPAGEILAEYVYDYQGQRVKKTENGVTTYYIGKHYEERKGDTVDEKTSYFFANSQRIAKSTQKNKGSPKLSYYLNNHLGSADVIVNEQGVQTDRLRYLPFGGYRTFPQERHTFTGKERDEVTDNYYFEARYYNSNIRRFTQADTIIPDLYDPQSLNRYSYTRNSPVVYVDPSGHFFDIVLDIAFIANDIRTLVTDPSSRTLVNYIALGADVAGAIIPCATGLGAGVKVAAAASKAKKAGKVGDVISGVKRGASEVVENVSKKVETDKFGKIISREPKSIQDKMTLEAAKQGKGIKKMEKGLKDEKFLGMKKWEYETISTEGRKSNVHYVVDPASEKLMDFKFTKHSTDYIPKYEKIQ